MVGELNKQYKFVVLSDSCANARSKAAVMKELMTATKINRERKYDVPEKYVVSLEDTYPYLLREIYKNSLFWQLSLGNIDLKEIVEQAVGYLSDWNPDFVIVHAGIIDCRPEAFSELGKDLINTLPKYLKKILKTKIYDPEYIAKRQQYRSTPEEYKNALFRLNRVFSKAKIIFIETCCAPEYEHIRPGVHERIIEYNQIAKQIVGNNYLAVSKDILDNKGFAIDGVHLNKKGHNVIIRKLSNKIFSITEDKTI